MSGDWLSADDPRDIPAVNPQEVVRQKAIEHAQLFLVFEQDARGAALLKQWIEGVEARDTPPNASHAEYAYWEGRRAFVRGIQRQVQLAKTEGRVHA